MASARTAFAPIDFKNRFPALDGIRALAVTMVFALHYGGGGTHGGPVLKALDSVRTKGGNGVLLFFVLSGFLITGILYDTRHDSRFFKRFYARRSLRIFPVFYLSFALIALLTPIFHYQWQLKQSWFLIYFGNFVANQDFSLYELPSLIHPAASVSLAHLWSLCVEEQFYLIFPLAVWLIKDRVKLLWTAGSICVLTLAFRALTVHLMGIDHAEELLMRTIFFHTDALLLGGILALLLRGPSADAIQRSMKWLFLIFLAATLLIFALAPASGRDPHYVIFGLSTINLASMGLIGMTLRAGSPSFRLFNHPVLRFIGKYSYGFYVFHYIFGAAWIQVLIFFTHLTHSTAIAGLITLPINYVVTLFVAKLSYDLFEVRFLKYKYHFEYDSELRIHKTAFAADGR